MFSAKFSQHFENSIANDRIFKTVPKSVKSIEIVMFYGRLPPMRNYATENTFSNFFTFWINTNLVDN